MHDDPPWRQGVQQPRGQQRGVQGRSAGPRAFGRGRGRFDGRVNARSGRGPSTSREAQQRQLLHVALTTVKPGFISHGGLAQRFVDAIREHRKQRCCTGWKLHEHTMHELLRWVYETPGLLAELHERLEDGAPICTAICRFLSAAAIPVAEARRNPQPPGGRHDNDHLNFRDIALLPTAAELLCDKPPYLPMDSDQDSGDDDDDSKDTVVDGQGGGSSCLASRMGSVSLSSADLSRPSSTRGVGEAPQQKQLKLSGGRATQRLLDAQFRLLREDMVAPMREHAQQLQF
ncbi:hypothetical protein JKP88DRAFT_248636 [Tribonema minus]|uniref:Uncharacterized protein n=1 Tax=Tribonema minus TaxID=303371 RepID=A0A836CAC3_9STRA|nr:hypothetical protein JKP88DRAFT_248636 [Tribonema minus]